jgi:hypothetical protein
MSMTDRVWVYDEVDATRLMLRCANGHELRAFDSKEMDEPYQARWLIGHGRLWTPARTPGYGEPIERHVEITEERILEHRAFAYDLAPITRAPIIYTECRQCPRALIVGGGLMLHGLNIWERAPMCEFRLSIEQGRVLRAEAVKLETRADIERYFAAQGQRVLADDDPIAVVYRERREAEAKERALRGLEPDDDCC